MKEFFVNLAGDKLAILAVCLLAFVNELTQIAFSFSGALSVVACSAVAYIGYRVFTDKAYENWHGTR